jgi:hypothetical protein
VTRRQLVLTAAVWAVFAGFAAWRSPIPGINEPHYLCKAKHFSDPSWCAGDFFIASANAHWVFYAVFGPLTRIFSLDQTAWIGRILVWGLLAWGWVRLVGRIVPGKFSPLWSAAIFLALQATGNLSGEWLIGGVEAKGFAYAALMLAIAAACDRSWIEAGIELGVAISIHPLIGLWGLAALAAAIVAGRPSQVVLGPPSIPDELSSSSYVAPTLRVLWLPAALCVIFSLPGLIPAIALLTDRPPGDQARIADVDQVFYRLKHHLDPAEFSTAAWLSYAGLLVAWLLMRRRLERHTAEKFFSRFVQATLAIAGGGLVAFGARVGGSQGWSGHGRGCAAAFGQPGVERVLDILRVELELVMKQCGTRSIAEIGMPVSRRCGRRPRSFARAST